MIQTYVHAFVTAGQRTLFAELLEEELVINVLQRKEAGTHMGAGSDSENRGSLRSVLQM